MGWTSRDWCWTVIFLVCLIIGIISIMVKSENTGAILNAAATLTAIILSVVAIISSFIQNSTFDKKLYDLDKKMDEIMTLKVEISNLSSKVSNNQMIEVLQTVQSSGVTLPSEQQMFIEELFSDIEATKKKISASDLFNI